MAFLVCHSVSSFQTSLDSQMDFFKFRTSLVGSGIPELEVKYSYLKITEWVLSAFAEYFMLFVSLQAKD